MRHRYGPGARGGGRIWPLAERDTEFDVAQRLLEPQRSRCGEYGIGVDHDERIHLTGSHGCHEVPQCGSLRHGSMGDRLDEFERSSIRAELFIERVYKRMELRWLVRPDVDQRATFVVEEIGCHVTD